MNSPKAVHLSGGNFFDDIRLDLEASYKTQDAWLASAGKKNAARRNALVNFLNFAGLGFFQKTGRLETLIMTGIIKGWFTEFHRYWQEVLGGRPLTLMDFHQLRFLCRQRLQSNVVLPWTNYEKHLAHWQSPEHFGLLFKNVYDCALHPIRVYPFFKRLGKNARVLEYGCAFAPVYRCYKHFFAHKKAKWTLADIGNYAYHCSRFLYAQDEDIENMILIRPEDFDDPLKKTEGKFDAVILITVFEHLHSPRRMAEYLLNRLKEGGLFVFDYIKSEAKSLDSEAGLKERKETLNYLKGRLAFVEGGIQDENESVGLCVGIKKKG